MSRVCPTPRCPNLQPCPVHETATQHGWRTAHGTNEHRLRGRKLQRARQALFAEEPLCRPCRKAGRLVVATIRDHIIPIAEGGTDEPENTQPLCQGCSDVKTRAEAERGRQRQGGASKC